MISKNKLIKVFVEEGHLIFQTLNGVNESIMFVISQQNIKACLYNFNVALVDLLYVNNI